jgi:hypothetical protein
MKQTRLDRLNVAIAQSGLKKGDIAERAGMHRQVLTDICSGKTPGNKHIEGICRVIGVSREWIEAGLNPPAFAQVSSGPAQSKPTDLTAVFLATVREISFHWHRLASTDLERYRALYGGLPGRLQRSISVLGRPLASFRLPLEDLVTLGEPFELPGPDIKAAFVEGFHQRQEDLDRFRRQRDTGDGHDLPPDVFLVCRAGLLGMKAQRIELDMPWKDIKTALSCLWERQQGMPRGSLLDFELRESDLREFSRSAASDWASFEKTTSLDPVIKQ